jgi:hypothetical protein
MSAVEVFVPQELGEESPRPKLRLVTLDTSATRWPVGDTLALRRASRARMLQRRRRTLVLFAGVCAVVVLAWPGAAFGGATGAGLPTDLASSSTLGSGIEYVVQPGDTVASIATLMNPLNPHAARSVLVRALHSSVVVTGEHILIP